MNKKYKAMQKNEEIEIENDLDSVFSSNSSENEIYFYSSVATNSILELNKKIRELTKELECKRIRYNLKEKIPINLYINSYGGDVLTSFSTIDLISDPNTLIHTHVEGFVASAASLISIVGKKRFMRENSFMLIHQVSHGFWGTYESLLDEKKNMDLLMNKLISIYEKYTKIPKKELQKILKRDLILDSKTCLKYGLVDEII